MGFIYHDRPLRLLVITGGHPFDRSAFAAMFAAMEDVAPTFVDHPAAEWVLNPEAAADYDALLFFDVPGIDLWGGLTRQQPATSMPSAAVQDGMRRLLTAGKGIVILHHAIAGWPEWTEYADWMGGRFHYLPGRDMPDSGYLQNATYDVKPIAAHPVTAGLPERFTLRDELYLYDVHTADVTPLLVADRTFEARDFHSATNAIAHNKMHSNEGWSHPDGSNLLAWVKPALNSPLVFIQPGDGPETYENPHYRRLVGNALRWVVTPEAHRWARAGASA